MVRLIAIAVAACCYFQPGLALAQDVAKQLSGSWKLTSWTIQVIDGEAAQPFGPNPKGRAVFTPDGFSAFMIARPDRKPGCGLGRAPQIANGLHRQIHNRRRQAYDQRRSIVERDFDRHGPSPVLQAGGRQALHSNRRTGQRGLSRQESGRHPHLGA